MNIATIATDDIIRSIIRISQWWTFLNWRLKIFSRNVMLIQWQNSLCHKMSYLHPVKDVKASSVGLREDCLVVTLVSRSPPIPRRQLVLYLISRWQMAVALIRWLKHNPVTTCKHRSGPISGRTCRREPLWYNPRRRYMRRTRQSRLHRGLIDEIIFLPITTYKIFHCSLILFSGIGTISLIKIW